MNRAQRRAFAREHARHGHRWKWLDGRYECVGCGAIDERAIDEPAPSPSPGAPE